MKKIRAYIITIKGLVQGVGFRPYIYQTAQINHIKGWVKNTNQDVIMHVEGKEQDLEKFVKTIQNKPPQASSIEQVDIKEIKISHYSSFMIQESVDISSEITQVSPDIAVCELCLSDMKKQSHRIDYPLINCTHCGPRFSIIKDLPYDRIHTTMADFMMCEKCSYEYQDITDRRFHAQPVACHHCGPQYFLQTKDFTYNEIKDILIFSANLLDDGKVLAMKGTGGYHLTCDAFNDRAVENLRKIKSRESKPFAVMFRDIISIKEYAIVSSEEEKLLTSWQRPIVLLQEKVNKLAPGVCQGFRQIGAMMPYIPFHYLLFENIKTKAIVLTSGNYADEPIVIDDRQAQKFKNKVDGIIYYNREIHNRTDDSVAFIANQTSRLIRRSRGYTPAPVKLAFNTEGIMATGAELMNTFCIGKGNEAIISQHIGDLKNYENYEFYKETIQKYMKLFRFQPRLIVCDKHPDYLSTRYAFESGYPILQVQHHYAHIASCLAVNKTDRPVIGFGFDGTGYGDDGHIWGGEVFICDLQKYKRAFHFEYMPLPGGDACVYEPWRTAVSYLYKSFGKNFLQRTLPFFAKIDQNKLLSIPEIIDKEINCPMTSSLGRLFDAISAITNICLKSGFHAEAPMRLENQIVPGITSFYSFVISDCIEVKTIIQQITDDIVKKLPIPEIATKFHNTIVQIIVTLAVKLKKETNINLVVLSGGIFQNRYLLSETEKQLKKNHFVVLPHFSIPCNDASISLGQLALAANYGYYDKT